MAKAACFMSTIPNDFIAHTEAQAAVMQAMLAEIECWRTWAASGAVSVGAEKKRSAHETTSEEKLSKAEKEIEKLRNQVKEAQDSRKEVQKKLDTKRREMAKAEREGGNDKRSRAKELELDDKLRRVGDKEKRADARERETERLAEKYRAKRRALKQVQEARDEIMKICVENPDVKQRLGKVVTRWKSESVARAGTSMRRPMSLLRPSPNLPPPSCTMKDRIDQDSVLLPPEVRMLRYDDDKTDL